MSSDTLSFLRSALYHSWEEEGGEIWGSIISKWWYLFGSLALEVSGSMCGCQCFKMNREVSIVVTIFNSLLSLVILIFIFTCSVPLVFLLHFECRILLVAFESVCCTGKVDKDQTWLLRLIMWYARIKRVASDRSFLYGWCIPPKAAVNYRWCVCAQKHSNRSSFPTCLSVCHHFCSDISYAAQAAAPGTTAWDDSVAFSRLFPRLGLYL